MFWSPNREAEFGNGNLPAEPFKVAVLPVLQQLVVEHGPGASKQDSQHLPCQIKSKSKPNWDSNTMPGIIHINGKLIVNGNCVQTKWSILLWNKIHWIRIRIPSGSRSKTFTKKMIFSRKNFKSYSKHVVFFIFFLQGPSYASYSSGSSNPSESGSKPDPGRIQAGSVFKTLTDAISTVFYHFFDLQQGHIPAHFCFTQKC